MQKLILVVGVNVLIVGFTAFLVARGSLPIVPWVPITSVAVLVLDAIALRRVQVTDLHTGLFLDHSTLLKAAKGVLILLAIACFSTILSSGWRIASGRVGLSNLIQIVGAFLVLWFTVSAIVALHRRGSDMNH